LNYATERGEVPRGYYRIVNVDPSITDLARAAPRVVGALVQKFNFAAIPNQSTRVFVISCYFRIVVCISRPRNHSLTYREKKLSPRPLETEARQSRGCKEFRGQGVHHIFLVKICT
jgi:hypothetical protein